MAAEKKDTSKNKEKMKYKDIIKNIGMDKLIIIAICGVVLVMFSIPSSSKSSSKSKSSNSSSENQSLSSQEISTDSYVKFLENKLETILSQVSGVGSVKVMITLKDSGEKIILKEVPYEKSQQSDKDSSGGTSEKSEISQSDTVVYEKDSNGNTIPYIIKINEPTIMGIAVIAEGGDNPNTVLKITGIVEALFGISAHKISVIGMSE